jgi:hypothetical protein
MIACYSNRQTGFAFHGDGQALYGWDNGVL